MSAGPKIKQKVKAALKIGFREEGQKKDRLTSVGHSISKVLDTNKSIFGSPQFLRFHNDTLLQNMTYFYKMRQLFHYNKRQKFITKCISFFC